MTPNDQQRKQHETDVDMLRATVRAIDDADGKLHVPETWLNARTAFLDMLDRISGDPLAVLSPKQRQWLESIAEQTEAQLKPMSASDVPTGRPVKLDFGKIPTPPPIPKPPRGR